jgi:hypothetical protein
LMNRVKNLGDIVMQAVQEHTGITARLAARSR